MLQTRFQTVILATQERRSRIVERRPDVGRLRLRLVEKDRSLPQDVPSFSQLPRPLTQGSVVLVELRQLLLVLCQGGVELVDGLRSTRTGGDEWYAVVESLDGYDVLFLFDLGGEKARAAGHVVDASNFTDERALEGVHAGIELYSNVGQSVDDSSVKFLGGKRTSLN